MRLRIDDELGDGGSLYRRMRSLAQLFVPSAVLLVSCACSLPAAAQADPATEDSLTLFKASLAAMEAGHLEDAVFRFYAGQLRFRLELAVCPPADESGGSEAVMAVRQELGETVNPAALRNPPVLHAALRRYDAWTPRMGPGTRPMWGCTKQVSPGAVLPGILKSKQAFATHMGAIATLLDDPEYFRSFRTVQDCNLRPEGNKPPAQACSTALGTMKRIETQRHVEGMATMQ